MNSISAPFIRRPVGTTLIAIGLMVFGLVAYAFLPVASLPSVEFPAIRVSAGRPGADPSTMAASVAAPLERALGSIPGVNEITSWSALGTTNIMMQFDLKRKIDSAARDVQAAINAAATDLPGDMPSLPSFKKANPAAQPILILALTSDTIPPDAMFDIADSLVAQRISQIKGVAEVTVNGAEQPAIRVRADPARLAAMGVGLEEVRAAIVAANTQSAVGDFSGERLTETIATSGQLRTVEQYQAIVVRVRNGAVVRLGDIASVERGVRNTRAAGWYNGRPAVIVNVTKQPDSNVIETVDGVKAVLPEIQRWAPAGLVFNVMSDRTVMIRASVAELQRTLLISIALVMLVVFVFLRRGAPTLAAGITIPLSLAGTFLCMRAAGFSVNNLSLMAIVISVGFVVDDAIVMIENIHRNMEAGLTRMKAAMAGARQIGFTVISISLSLIAAFIPLLFMEGVMGRMFREFSVTLAAAIAVSAFVSLTVTPMICGRFMAKETGVKSRFDRIVERGLDAMRDSYARTLDPVLRHPLLILMVVFAVIGLTVQMFRTAPRGNLPEDDSGLLLGWTDASPDVSFPAMRDLQKSATDVIVADPAVATTASFVGGGWSVNSGRININLKPGESSRLVIARLRDKLNELPGIKVFLVPITDVRVGARSGRSNNQFTLWSSNAEELFEWGQKALEALKKVPELVDVATDREKEGLQAKVVIDRDAASRMGVAIQAVDAVLSDALSQRLVSTIYGDRNQYRVVLEVTPSRQRDPNDLSGLYVAGLNGAQVPLSAVARIERGVAPLSINHTGQFASITLTYNPALNIAYDEANAALQAGVAALHMPDTVHADFSGDAKAFVDDSNSQIVLLFAALIAVYIILGILYESLVHPLTIISTLPSAGLGALVALRVANMELTIIAFIGMILLIGLVKKNGILMVDFAIAAERGRGLTPQAAIREACVARFRPILMTTVAAIFGAMPLVVATGAGSELRRPLGVVIVGGLVLSQLLTLYSTPVIYLLMNRFRRADRPSLLQKAGLAPGREQLAAPAE